MKRLWFARPRSTIAALVVMCAAVVLPALPSSGAVPANVVQEIAKGGFGDSSNDYAWSMAWFKGKLYVGTSRDAQCVENATLDYYYPGHNFYPGNENVGVTCPPDKADLDLRAEIWQYSPFKNSWTRVYQSPADIPNPNEAGKYIARDIGFRGMVVYRGQLYVADNTANEIYPSIAAQNPPRIMRSPDGVHWTPVNGAPGPINDPSGTQTPMGYRAMAVYHGRMFVTVIAGLTGDGVVEEVHNPAGPNTTFTQVSPATMRVFEMQVFNNQLYIGTGDSKTGYGVYRTHAWGKAPYTFTPVVTNGAGRGAGVTSVVSMGVFQGHLYVGASGWYNSALPVSELIRVARNGKWDVVAGKPRMTPQGYKAPISGLSDGFGNPFNAHFWRQTAHRNAYFVGTNDWSYAWDGFPILGNLLKPGFGFDVWGTCDGKYWWVETQNAFGDGADNFGARTMVSTPWAGFMVGSANHVQGTAVFRDRWLRPCSHGKKLASRPTGAAVSSNTFAPRALAQGTTTVPTAAMTPPNALTSAASSTGTALTWEASAGASSYVVLRADYVVRNDVDVVKPPTVDGLQVSELPDPTRAQTTAAIPVPTDFTAIGSSTTPSFTDTTATPGAQYLYEVVAVGGAGQQSVPSNVTGSPTS